MKTVKVSLLSFFQEFFTRKPQKSGGDVVVRFEHHDTLSLVLQPFLRHLRQFMREWFEKEGQRLVNKNWEIVVSIAKLPKEGSVVLSRLTMEEGRPRFRFTIPAVERDLTQWQEAAWAVAQAIIAFFVEQSKSKKETKE